MADYIDKKLMYDEFVKHKERVAKAREEGKEDPILPDYIGYCFMLLAEKIASRPNFSQYSYIDEMISDGIENCITAANNFDPKRNEKNPFGYFSKVIWWAFLRRIDTEKKETYVKYKSMENLSISGDLYNGDPEDMKNMSSSVDKNFINNVINDFEQNKKNKDEKNKSKPKKKKGVELLISDEEEKEELSE